jgi:hypothetical protein
VRAKKNEWMTHEYFRTYRIANAVETIMRDPFAYLRDLEALTIDNGIYDFLPHWQKNSALHKFIRFIADDILMDDTHGPTRVPFGPDALHPQWILPADAAMMNYGITREPLFLIPDNPALSRPPTDEDDSPGPEDHYVANACYDYLVDLRLTQAYEVLMSRIADEVFYVMFLNRRALANLNRFLAMYVDDVSPENLGVDEIETV